MGLNLDRFAALAKGDLFAANLNEKPDIGICVDWKRTSRVLSSE